jgi:hypothetical protein
LVEGYRKYNVIIACIDSADDLQTSTKRAIVPGATPKHVVTHAILFKREANLLAKMVWKYY